MFFDETVGHGKQDENTRLYTHKFLKNFFKKFLLYRPNNFFLIFRKRRVDRCVFSYSLPFPKISAKNIYYCCQKLKS